VYCDVYPDWQEYRAVAHIAFTDQHATDAISPCPSTWRRDPGTRDKWFGNELILEAP
jgi:hypothetical protein